MDVIKTIECEIGLSTVPVVDQSSPVGGCPRVARDPSPYDQYTAGGPQSVR